MDEHITQNEALAADKSTEFSLLPIKKKKSGRVPDFFIAVPAFLALEAFQINTDEDDTGGQLWVHRLTGYYIKNLSGGIFAGVLSLSEEPTRLYRISGWGDYVRTLPERGELGINLAKKHPSLHPLTAHGEGEIYLHRNKLQDIIEIANLAMSKGCGFTVLRFEGMQLVDAEKRKQYREMLAKVYAGTLFLNAGYRNVTPGAAPQAAPATVRQDFAGSTIIMYNFFW
ncbi:hypothetical protein [Treponema endosymbiont of Eucomonympha sp.]|uniref:hypothetical protein n=1 Tax=Treponema endosymbiont of Eucomonympha sp. TaxID=1580831 RepID=UPI0007517B4D|nr:hypothetical protein [Treponema endosymbiont of Eucomonympha sp.]